MTREFFTPERKRWIAPFIHFASGLMSRLNSRLSPSLGDPPGAQSHWIATAIARSAHCDSRRPTILVTSNAAFWEALFSKRSTFSDALAPALSLRLRRIRHGTQKEFRMNSRLSRTLGW